MGLASKVVFVVWPNVPGNAQTAVGFEVSVNVPVA